MPAQKLPIGQAATSTTAPAYCIVGMYSDPADAQFVRHVAILAEESPLESGKAAAVWHMGPPLVAGKRTRMSRGATLECPIHLFATASLDLDDQEGIEDWLEEVDKEPPQDNPFKRYVVRPHWDWHTAPETARPLYRRFSCAGFVLECYKSIGIDLVNTEERGLPDVEFNILVKAYPQIARKRVLERQGLTRDDLGIPGDGPWRIVLAGYVFHALDRIRDEDPRPGAHKPASVAEAHFPRPVEQRT